MQNDTTVKPVLGRGTLFAMAVATGLAVANIYYNQPMLGTIARSFPGSGAVALIPTLTQIGYALGLLLLLPLGDLFERRRLIVMQSAALAVASLLAAVSSGVASLVAASVLIGAAATVAQQIVPFAAMLAAPEKRGQALGTVMSGLLTGILLSRTLAGFVATYMGWRAMFWISAPLAVFTAALMWFVLPDHRPTLKIRYGALLRSVYWLWRTEPLLRRASLTQALLFASFSTFWTILSLRLEQPAFHLGADAAGLFGIVGAAGVLMAPLAGRIADQRGPHLVIAVGAVLTVLSWVAFGTWPTLAGMIVGVTALDMGVQVCMVSHQHLVYGIHPDFKSRLNTVYMTSLFLGGAIGSAGGAIAWAKGGWLAVCVVGALLALLAFGNQFRTQALRGSAAHASSRQ